PWTKQTVKEWFLTGTEPGATTEVDPPGLLYDNSCGFWTVDPLKAELGPQTWDVAVANWMARAQRGPGVEGELGSKTAYFWGRTSWGGPVGTCQGGFGLGIRRAEPKPAEDVKADKPKPDKDTSKPPEEPKPPPE